MFVEFMFFDIFTNTKILQALLSVPLLSASFAKRKSLFNSLETRLSC